MKKKLFLRKKTMLTGLLVLANFVAASQDTITTRTIEARRVTLPLKIDGDIHDEAWKSATLVNRFVEQRPVFNRPEEEKTRTETWIMYDDNAVYIGGYCHENSRDSIATELVGRDRVGINDYAGVMFDTYRDQINGVGFYVTALGEQYDCKYSLGNEDGSWSTVFQTATKLLPDGWTFEMRIPYSALRFSKNNIQNWGINFVRRRSKSGRQYSWNPLDPNKFGLMNQAGTWTNIQDIRSPIRLSFSPYFSTYLNRTPVSLGGTKAWESSFNGGMDVKYGISKAFTLDMTLIPDFGQVQSDNQVLNLSPFEVRYNENRSFFTEGTELFNKGNLFYSRRIGGEPVNSWKAYSLKDSTDVILENPHETKLVNATKISGRTAKGLGVGFFNAIVKPQNAVLRDKNNHEYKIQTSPWTNYNIIVLDQTMKNNSSVTLVNTSVLRNGHEYDANVTAGLFDLYDKKVDWNIWGKLANSRLSGPDLGKTISGFNYEMNLGKFRGPFNFEVHQFAADTKYEQNDMGYFTNNNYFDNGFGAWYKINKPKGFYNNMFFSARGNYSQMYKPRKFQSAYVGLNGNSQLKNLWVVGFNSDINLQQQDFYEPRSNGRMFKRPSSWMAGFFVNTNSAKKYAASFEYYNRISSKYNSTTQEISLGNQYRFNDKLNIGINSYAQFAKNNVGFAGKDSITSLPAFGLRDRHTVENIFNIKYNFNTLMGLTFRARHYWSRVRYSQLYDLKEDGFIQEGNPVIENPDNNVNIFNIDMVYTWQFALGSFINIGWKSSGYLENQLVRERYFNNLGKTLQSSQQHNFSLKVIYYLDYLDLKKKTKKSFN